MALLDHISSFNSSESTTTLLAGEPVPFSTNQTSFRTSIVQTDSDTFTIGETGHYRVTAVLQTDFSTSVDGGVTLELNGVPIGPQRSIVDLGGNLVLDEIIEVSTVPSTLEVVATGLGLTLAVGDSATITITRVSDLAAPLTQLTF